MSCSPPPLVLFGAFDRHNLGDLLFARVARGALVAPGRPATCCGLADRDLRRWGGPRTQGLHRLAAAGALAGADLVHVGGEVLDCTADQAATMLLPPDEVDATRAWLAAEPDRAAPWRRAMLGSDAPLPYLVSRRELPGLRRVLLAPVGGVSVGALADEDRRALMARLAEADLVQVRDALTHARLREAGIAALLAPDPVETFRAPPSDVRPPACLALQLAAEFDDDATLERLADALAPAARRRGLEVVAFRAGAAPWHDDPRTPARVVARLRARGATARTFESLVVDDLVGLLAAATACVASSLHALVVAAGHGVPVVGLRKPGARTSPDKLAAYVDTWHPADGADGVRVADPGDLAPALASVLATDPRGRRTAALARTRRAADALARVRAAIDAPGTPDRPASAP